jgi:DNA-directed RNA polymerase subunit RPC12/RpoP
MNEKKIRKTNASEKNFTGACVRCKRQIDKDNPAGGVEEQHVGSTIQRGFVCQECERPNPADDQKR